jgi:integrase
MPSRPVSARIDRGSFAAVIRAYTSSPKFQGYARNTRIMWARELSLAEIPPLGALPVAQVRPSLIQAFLDGYVGRPGKQQAALTALKQLERWAVVRDLLPNAITLGVEVEHSDGGHVPWTDEHVAIAEEFARPDLARVITLGANTGQRGSDLVKMRWTDIEEFRGRPGINVVQVKTKRKLWVPLSTETIRYKRRRGRLKGRQKTYVYYKARITVGGRVIQLGHFSTPGVASAAYRKAKMKAARSSA